MKDDVKPILAGFAQSDRFHADGIASTYRRIAAQLNALSSPPAHWSWNYLHQVVRGKLEPSSTLESAILQLQNKLKIRERQTPVFETTQVVAPAGFISPGSIVSTPSRKCLSSLCNQSFIPSHPNQRFCSPDCRHQFHRVQTRKK